MPRRRPAKLLALALLASACAGRSAEPTSSATGDEATTQPPAQPSATPPGDVPASSAPVFGRPGEPRHRGTTATRDGRSIGLSMCFDPARASEGPLRIWGQVTDPASDVDEAIVSFDVTPASARGAVACVDARQAGPGARVVFAEGRGAEYAADPRTCSFSVDDGAAATVEGHVAATYTDARGARHSFTVDFAAAPCGP